MEIPVSFTIEAVCANPLSPPKAVAATAASYFAASGKELRDGMDAVRNLCHSGKAPIYGIMVSGKAYAHL